MRTTTIDRCQMLHGSASVNGLRGTGRAVELMQVFYRMYWLATWIRIAGCGWTQRGHKTSPITPTAEPVWGLPTAIRVHPCPLPRRIWDAAFFMHAGIQEDGEWAIPTPTSEWVDRKIRPPPKFSTACRANSPSRMAAPLAPIREILPGISCGWMGISRPPMATGAIHRLTGLFLLTRLAIGILNSSFGDRFQTNERLAPYEVCKS